MKLRRKGERHLRTYDEKRRKMHKERETERKRAQRQKNKGNAFIHSSFDLK